MNDHMAQDGEATMQPFLFIVGAGRSGTTLLRSMFDSHPEIAIPDVESYFITRLDDRRSLYERNGELLIEKVIADLTSANGFRVMNVEPEDVRERLLELPHPTLSDVVRVTFALYAARFGKQRYGDKTPIYVVKIHRLSVMFPEARFIHIVRDGRDVARSSVAAGFSRDWREGLLKWRHQVGLARDASTTLGPERYTEVRYEDLVADPEVQLQRLCLFLSLPYADDVLEFHESAANWAAKRADPTVHESLSRPLSIGARSWATDMSEKEKRVASAIAGARLEEFGYDTTQPIGLRAHAVALGTRLSWDARRAWRSGRSRSRTPRI